MSSEVDKSGFIKNDIPINDNNSDSLKDIKKEFVLLSEKAQQLLTDKIFLENECSRLKKRANRLEEELLTYMPHHSWLDIYKIELMTMLLYVVPMVLFFLFLSTHMLIIIN